MKTKVLFRSFFTATLLSIGVVTAIAKQIDVRDLPSFKAIDASGVADVILEKGNVEQARVEVDKIDVSRVITKVDNGTLHIYLKDKSGFGSVGRITVYVSYKKLASVISSGSGDVMCKTPIESSNISVKSTGSGDLKLNAIAAKENIRLSTRGSGDVFIRSVLAKAFSVKLSGSGDLKIDTGSADAISFSLSGSGDISAGGLKGKSVNASTSGSGDIKTHCTGALQVKISGFGDVGYYGNPPSKNVNKSGSGDARSL